MTKDALERIVGWLLMPIVGIGLCIFFAAFFTYRAIAPVHDWYRRRRRAGVLFLVEPGPAEGCTPDIGAASRSPLASGPAEAAAGSPALGDDGYAFGYTEVDHAVFRDYADDDEAAAYWLARLPERPSFCDDEPGAFESNPWKDFELDDPANYRRYREGVSLGRLLTKTEHCLYCGATLLRRKTDDLKMHDRSLAWRYHTAECLRCGWWCVTYRLAETALMGLLRDSESYFHAYAVMRRFDPLALDTPLSVARDYLSRNPHKLARFDPYRFEDLVTDCLRDHFGDGEVIKLGGRKDRGIDIKAMRAGGKTVLVQVKRRSDFAKREGVRTIRHLHGVMLREGVPSGMVVTTAHDFTADAKADVAQAESRLRHYSMDLLPLADLLDLLGRARTPQRSPWEGHGIHVNRAEPDWQQRSKHRWIERAVLPQEIEHVF